MNHPATLKDHESAAQRLRIEYDHDLLVRAAIAFDLAIRRAADRVLPAGRAPHTRLTASN